MKLADPQLQNIADAVKNEMNWLIEAGAPEAFTEEFRYGPAPCDLERIIVIRAVIEAYERMQPK